MSKLRHHDVKLSVYRSLKSVRPCCYLSVKYLERNPLYVVASKCRLQVWLPPPPLALGSSEKAAARIQMDGLEMALNGCLINHLQFENNTITRLAGLTRSHHPVETAAGVAKQDAGTLITTSATTTVSNTHRHITIIFSMR